MSAAKKAVVELLNSPVAGVSERILACVTSLDGMHPEKLAPLLEEIRCLLQSRGHDPACPVGHSDQAKCQCALGRIRKALAEFGKLQ